MFVDNELKFGASTRTYIVREKPQMSKHAINPSSILNTSGGDSINESGTEKEDSFSLLTSLPESETELDVNFFILKIVLFLMKKKNLKFKRI